jgi:rhodanese-related sulfurtransferase
VKKIDAIQLKEMIQKQTPTLINVLDEEQFRKEHIPGSINIPAGRERFAEEVERHVSSRKDPVVVYCASETCKASPGAAHRLERAGFSSVYDFEGGMKEWKEVGRPIEAGV